MTVSKIKISKLELVYPPISNQEAVWLQGDPEVEKDLRESDFYAIGARAEARFTDFAFDGDARVISFNMRVGDADCEPVKLRMNELPGIREKPGGQVFAVETGPKVVRMWDGPVGAAASNVLAWFTTEKLLYDKAHGVPGISGLDRCRDLATYDLLYVGIATKGDSFDRLMARGHKRRMDILANEPQRWPGARVTDEIFLFLFRVNSLLLQTFQPGHDFTESDFASQPDRKRIVADAEKAFVSMLQLQYNVVRFETYPQGRDGLFGSSLARYGYVIDETLVFNTTHGRIRGAHDLRGVISNDADFISIEGEKVSLYVSGVDFFAGAHQ